MVGEIKRLGKLHQRCLSRLHHLLRLCFHLLLNWKVQTRRVLLQSPSQLASSTFLGYRRPYRKESVCLQRHLLQHLRRQCLRVAAAIPSEILHLSLEPPFFLLGVTKWHRAYCVKRTSSRHCLMRIFRHPFPSTLHHARPLLQVPIRAKEVLAHSILHISLGVRRR